MRDLERDKELILKSENANEVYRIANHWIAQYKAQQAEIERLKEWITKLQDVHEIEKCKLRSEIELCRECLNHLGG